jgi:hypothetical protein
MEDIYSNDYWQRQVSILIKEKKNFLRQSQKSHLEIRKINEEKEQLKHLLKNREQELADIKFNKALVAARHKKGCLS